MQRTTIRTIPPWTDIDARDGNAKSTTAPRTHFGRFSRQEAEEMAELHHQGLSMRVIGVRYHVTATTISDVLRELRSERQPAQR